MQTKKDAQSFSYRVPRCASLAAFGARPNIRYPFGQQDVAFASEATAPQPLLALFFQGAFETTESLVFFENKKVRYLWDHDLKVFTRLRGFDRNVPCSYFHQQKGISLQEQLVR